MHIAKTVILAVVLALALHAEDKRSWDNLNSLRPGQQVQIKTKGSEKLTGTFLGFKSDSISIHAKNRDREFQRTEVQTVKRKSGAVRLRHALIGAGIGAGAGAAIAVPNISEGYASGAAVAGSVIALVGATVIGALLPAHSTMYEAGP